MLIEFIEEHKSGRYFIMVRICALTLECVPAVYFWLMQKTRQILARISLKTQNWVESVSPCIRKCQIGDEEARVHELRQDCLRSMQRRRNQLWRGEKSLKKQSLKRKNGVGFRQDAMQFCKSSTKEINWRKYSFDVWATENHLNNVSPLKQRFSADINRSWRWNRPERLRAGWPEQMLIGTN